MQPHHELILGGQKSGKTARAEHMAAHWLAAAQAPTQTSAENIATAPQAEAQPRRAIYIATAQPWDEEMRQRIARHQSERAQRVPSMVTLETTDLPAALASAAKATEVGTIVPISPATAGVAASPAST